MEAMTNISDFILVIAFGINIIVQMTKTYVPMPTKLWCIVVSLIVNFLILASAQSLDLVEFNTASIAVIIFSAFVSAYIAMYGFDTFKEIWRRFRGGDNINEYKRKDL